MDYSLDTEALTALGHPGRLAVFRLLARRAPHGVRPSEIADALELKANTLSAYVSALTRAGLLVTWREGRSVYYGINVERIGALVDFLVNDCCRGRPELCEPLVTRALARSPVRDAAATPLDVLFVCTGNSARSIFAEAILNAEGKGRFRAHSAGTSPAARLHPEAVEVLKSRGHCPEGLAPKSLASFEQPDALPMDVVITVCDRAANEDCPPLPGLPVTAHWGVPDPSAVSEDKARAAFEAAYDAIEARIRRFLEIGPEGVDPLALQNRLDAAGQVRTGSPG
jgi:arsenate reductase